MRFHRFGLYEFQDTPRKRAAVLRRNRLECEAHPLFAEEIAASQDTPEAAMAWRREEWTRRQVESRLLRAQQWRKARAQLRSYGPEARRAISTYWQRCSLPADPEYMMTLCRIFDTGRLSLAGEFIHDYASPT